MTPRFGTLPREQWPLALCQGPEGALVGVFVGGCVAWGVGSSFRSRAHAHCEVGDAHIGWVCLRTWKHLDRPRILLHELAHVITGQGHTDAFRRMLLQLGGTLDVNRDHRDYHKRARVLKDPRRPHLGWKHHPSCPCGRTF